MEKILKIVRFIGDCFINIVVISGILIFLLWAIWDVSPQASITKAAYFFSESWRLISGRALPDQPRPDVTKKQLEDSKKNIQYIYK